MRAACKDERDPTQEVPADPANSAGLMPLTDLRSTVSLSSSDAPSIPVRSMRLQGAYERTGAERIPNSACEGQMGGGG